jgi:hypothetical protein
MDDPRIYNRALSADEIKRLYNLGGTVKLNKSQSTGSLSQGLVGWWTFDGNDMAGNYAVDKSGTGNRGTLTGSNGLPTRTIGKLGQGMNFDGVDDFVNAGTGSNINDLTQMTVSAWIYPRTFGGNDRGMIFSKITGGGAGWKFSVENSAELNSLSFYHTYDVNYLNSHAVSNSGITLNQWQHVAVTWDGGPNRSNVHYYINGVPIATSFSSGSDGSTVLGQDASASLGVGENGNGADWFNGLIDDARIYNRVLSNDEIKRLYQIGGTAKINTAIPGPTKGLVGYWTFDGP